MKTAPDTIAVALDLDRLSPSLRAEVLAKQAQGQSMAEIAEDMIRQASDLDLAGVIAGLLNELHSDRIHAAA